MFLMKWLNARWMWRFHEEMREEPVGFPIGKRVGEVRKEKKRIAGTAATPSPPPRARIPPPRRSSRFRRFPSNAAASSPPPWKPQSAAAPADCVRPRPSNPPRRLPSRDLHAATPVPPRRRRYRVALLGAAPWRPPPPLSRFDGPTVVLGSQPPCHWSHCRCPAPEFHSPAPSLCNSVDRPAFHPADGQSHPGPNSRRPVEPPGRALLPAGSPEPDRPPPPPSTAASIGCSRISSQPIVVVFEYPPSDPHRRSLPTVWSLAINRVLPASIIRSVTSVPWLG